MSSLRSIDAMADSACPCLMDVSRLVKRLIKGRLPTGIDRVSLAYINRYGPSSRAFVRLGRFHAVLPEKRSQCLFRHLLNPRPDFMGQALWLLAVGAVSAAGSSGLSGRLFFNIGHSGLEDRNYEGLLRRLGVRPVFMVHDLIPITHPEYSRPGEREKHLVRMRTALGLARGIIANSQATLDSISAFALSEAMPLPPTSVAWLAPHEPIAPSAEPPSCRPYFVMVGTIEPRKNHLLLLQVWRRLIEQLGERAPLLVIIGQRGWECENVIDILERCEMLRGHVLELSSCADDKLAGWLRHARALLFPSFAEGFGLPLVEALALGTPVIASNLPVFSEIAGDIPDYLDPLNAPGWLGLISEYTAPGSRARKLQVQRMSRFTVPTWKEHFSRVDGLLERVVS